MKHAYSNILKMVIFSFTTNTFALNVVQGWYAGLLLGPTYTPTVYSPALAQTALNAVANAGTTTGLPTTPTTGELQYKILGDLAVMAGYRCNPFRIEGQIYANAAPYNFLRIDDYTIHTHKASSTKQSPTTGAPTTETFSNSTGLRFKGQTTTLAILANGFYDVYLFGESTNIIPFVGIGIGYAWINNQIKFYYDNQLVPNTNQSKTAGATAAQAIAGADYFIDDFTSIGIDFRYFATQKTQPWNVRTIIYSINASVKGSFDCA